DVAGAQVFQLGDVSAREGAHEVALGDDADHAVVELADRKRADAIGVEQLGDVVEYVIGDTGDQPLVRHLKIFADFHGSWLPSLRSPPQSIWEGTVSQVGFCAAERRNKKARRRRRAFATRQCGAFQAASSSTPSSPAAASSAGFGPRRGPL